MIDLTSKQAGIGDFVANTALTGTGAVGGAGLGAAAGGVAGTAIGTIIQGLMHRNSGQLSSQQYANAFQRIGQAGNYGALAGAGLGAIAGGTIGNRINALLRESSKSETQKELERSKVRLDQQRDGLAGLLAAKTAGEKFDRARMRRVLQKTAAMGTANPLSLYAPIIDRREFTDAELDQIAESSDRLLPKIWQSNRTPAHKLLASPSKQGLLAALAAGSLGAAGGGLMGASLGRQEPSLRGGLIGAAGVGSLSALVGGLLQYYSRKQQNEDITELMRRLPPNANVRDLKSDPAYQADLNRKYQAQQMAAITNALAAGQFAKASSYQGMDKEARIGKILSRLIKQPIKSVTQKIPSPSKTLTTASHESGTSQRVPAVPLRRNLS